jgi:hypothetical protein
MVDFKPVPLTDPRLTKELRNKFLNVGQLVEWKVTEGSETYTGLVIVGEKPHPQGFQSMADFTIDLGNRNEIAITKVQALTQEVMGEFKRRAVIGTKKPGQA